MLSGHVRTPVFVLVATSLLAGCAQSGPVLSRRTSLGTLKTSLSHLEFENQQLRAKMTKLESENRAIENRLVQEEEANGDLHARLDDARNALGRKGDEWGEPGGSASASASARRDEPGPGDSASRTLPTGRSTRKARKPPFAQVPNRVDSLEPDDDPRDTFGRPRSSGSTPFDSGPQSWQTDDAKWLPIAHGTSEPASRVR
jgi:hypothetical protein